MPRRKKKTSSGMCLSNGFVATHHASPSGRRTKEDRRYMTRAAVRGLSQAAMSSLLAGLVDENEDRAEALRSQLDAARKEVKRLQELHQQRLDVSKQIKALEADAEKASAAAQSARDEARAFTRRVEAEEERRKAGDAAEKPGRWVDPAQETTADPDTKLKALEILRRRKATKSRLLAALRDPEAAMREEDALKSLESEIKAVERARVSHVRELSLRTKQVDAGRNQMQTEQSRAEGGGQADSEDSRATKEVRHSISSATALLSLMPMPMACPCQRPGLRGLRADAHACRARVSVGGAGGLSSASQGSGYIHL